MPGRGSSEGRGPEAGVSLACSVNVEASVARVT